MSNLVKEESYILELSEHEKAELMELINYMELDHINLNSEDLLAVKEFSKRLPDSIYRKLINFKRFSNDNGIIVFKNLPVDQELPNTPPDGKPSDAKSSYVSESILFLFMSILGDVFGYEDEKNAQLVHDICPIEGQEKNIENSGSDVFFSYHVEDAIHPFKPDYLCLNCLKSDHDKVAITETSSVSEAIKFVSKENVDILRKPLFNLNPPASFKSEDLVRTIPVISGSEKNPSLIIHESLMKGINDEAEKALNELKAALPKASVGVQLNPGDYVIIDNNKAAHARSSFKPRYDGEDRWLQRMFAINNLKGLDHYLHNDKNIFKSLRYIFNEHGNK